MRGGANNNKLTDRAKKLIVGLLKKKVSPELICGRLKHEGDTIVGKSKDRTADSINYILYKASNGNKILTAIFDDGKEFAKHKKLTSKTGIKVFFASPYLP